MSDFTHLPNIGKALNEQLHQVGIEDEAQLRAAGSRDAWLRIQAVDPSACLMRLYALEGALRGVRSRDLPGEIKADLKAFYGAHK